MGSKIKMQFRSEDKDAIQVWSSNYWHDVLCSLTNYQTKESRFYHRQKKHASLLLLPSIFLLPKHSYCPTRYLPGGGAVCSSWCSSVRNALYVCLLSCTFAWVPWTIDVVTKLWYCSASAVVLIHGLGMQRSFFKHALQAQKSETTYHLPRLERTLCPCSSAWVACRIGCRSDRSWIVGCPHTQCLCHLVSEWKCVHVFMCTCACPQGCKFMAN